MKVGDIVRLKDEVTKDNPAWVVNGGWLYIVEIIRPHSSYPVTARSLATNKEFIFYFDELEVCDEIQEG